MHPALYCFKKALFLLAAIHIRFSHLEPAPFDAPDINSLPVFSDNVLPSLLIHLGVLDVTSCPSVRQEINDMSKEGDLSSLLGSPSTTPSSQEDQIRSKTAPRDGVLLKKEQAYLLRAAAIDACEMIVAEARSMDFPSQLQWIKTITLPQVDLWLWAVAKDRADYRALSRFVERDTAFF